MRTKATAFVALAVAFVLVAGGAWGLVAAMRHIKTSSAKLSASVPLPATSITSQDGSGTVAASSSAVTTSTGPEIEIPALKGKDIKVAEALIEASGLTVQTRVSDPPVTGVTPDTVLNQWPAAGALVASGSVVVMTYQPRTATSTASPYVVVIDAGHQQKADLALEPIGPGSKVTKPKVAGGATGATTGKPEYALALAISLKIRDILITKGVNVVMVRTSNAVDIPNSKRAEIANNAKADLFLRIHLNGDTDASVKGIQVLYPAGNAWIKAIEAPSLKAAQAVGSAVVKATGAAWLGLSGRSDQSGFNYCTRPAVTVECGFLSNVAEEKLLVANAYQQKLADGIAQGTMTFLAGE